MATFTPFDCLPLDIGKGLHKFDTDTLKVYLTNTAPVLTNTVYNTPADLATSGGYTAGGQSAGVGTWSQSSGVASYVASVGSVTFSATTGFGPFRYAVLYNFTATAKNLIGYWDNGASVSVGASPGVCTVTFTSPLFTLRFN